MTTKFPSHRPADATISEIVAGMVLQLNMPLESWLAPDLTPDELIEKCRRRQREWARLRREFETWLATHPEIEEPPPA